jgi:hypothetical protein
MATSEENLNEHGNHAGRLTQTVGGWAEYTVYMTPSADKVIHDLPVPPKKVIPIVFLPGVMGSNLRMSIDRQKELEREHNKTWRADDIVSASGKLTTLIDSGDGGWFRDAKLGAATSYKRMRFGFRENETPFLGYPDKLTSQVIARDGEHATAILANAPGPLELLPAKAYGEKWLRVVDGNGIELASWPDMRTDAPQTAVDAIYLQPADAWWRLINPEWVNPRMPGADSTKAAQSAYDRLKDAYRFANAIDKTFHPMTYASWCASSARRSYGEVIFRVIEGDTTQLPKAATWKLLTDDGKKILTVQAGNSVLTLERQPAAEAGDETVPAKRSAEHIIGHCFEHGAHTPGYEHQDSYTDGGVAASTLYGLMQIAKTDKWQ